MPIIITPANQQTTSHWGGGTTTQLCIYPFDSDYVKRNCIFRISSATIDIEESIFTKLPGYNRTLMVLKGSLKLIHADHHTKKLKPLETDNFQGDWDTKSKGKAVDFNVMTSEKASHSISSIKHSINPIHLKPMDFIAGYVIEGTASIQSDNIESTKLSIYDFFLWENKGEDPPSLLTEKDSTIVLTEINLNRKF